MCEGLNKLMKKIKDNKPVAYNELTSTHDQKQYHTNYDTELEIVRKQGFCYIILRSYIIHIS